jgi:replicative DNA helicase
MNDLLNRIPPNNTDAEESILSALLIDNRGFDSVGDLTPGDFYATRNGKIFSAMLGLIKSKRPVDLMTVHQEMNENGTIESVGGAAYLTTIADTAPVAVNVAHYVRIVKDLATAREMIRISLGIANAGFAVSDIEEYISQSQSKVLDVQTTTSVDTFHTMCDLMIQTIERIEDAQKRGIVAGYDIGLPSMAKALRVHGSKLLLLAGRPGMGKTALALSMARFLARQSVKVGFLSIEMDREEISDRILSAESDTNSLCFYEPGMLTKTRVGELYEVANIVSELPIVVDDSECTIADVERKCRKMKQMGCQVIFIDQLSKIRGKNGASKFDTYSDHCSAIALLKKELRIPIVLLCQLNREVEQRNDKTPQLSDLKQTGMLEEDADIVMMLYRPGYYNEQMSQEVTEIHIPKNRQGAVGVEKQVSFNPKRVCFNLGVGLSSSWKDTKNG